MLKPLLFVTLALVALPTGGHLGAQEPEPAAVEPDTAQEPARRRPVSPGSAFVRSFVIPGWGQIAADQPARGAIYFGVWSTGLFMIVKSQNRLEAAERAGDENLIESRKQQREDWIVITAFVALFAGVDAWVSAQFGGFEGELRPPDDGAAGLQISYPVALF